MKKAVGLSAVGSSDDYSIFRTRTFTAIMMVAMVFAALFGVMHDTGVNPLNDFHARMNYVYAGSSLLLLLGLRRLPDRINLFLAIFLLLSHLTFTSAFINVPADQFRPIWFYLLVLVSYMLAGPGAGIIMTVAALATMLWVSLVMETGLSSVTLTSALLGLIILSLIAQTFSRRSLHYARLVEEKNRQLEKLVNEDPLTGIMNARSFHEVSSRIFELERRSSKGFTLLYLDIDHFKQINDRYGHYAGDQVLIALTQIISAQLRKSDVFARIGGEEFCIILPETDIEGAKVLAEKMRHVIETTGIPLDGETLYPTTSIGIASLEPGDTDMRSIQDRADENLYEAKRCGRNCVVAA